MVPLAVIPFIIVILSSSSKLSSLRLNNAVKIDSQAFKCLNLKKKPPKKIPNSKYKDYKQHLRPVLLVSDS